MKKRMKLFFLAWALLALLGSLSLSAWEAPIRVAGGDGNRYQRPSVSFGPSGKLFMVYEFGNETTNRDDIYLSIYDGKELSPAINVTAGNPQTLRPYYPAITVSKNEELHVVWLEYLRAAQTLAQYLRYRYFDGKTWGPIETLHTLAGSAWCEEPHVAVDSNNNIFVSVYNETNGRCAVATKYFGKKATVDFPNVAGRSKYASIAADDNFVHLAWQYLGSGDSYTVMYVKKKNQEGSQWLTPLDFHVSYAQKPKVDLNNDGNPLVAFAKKETNSSRNFRLRLWDEQDGLTNRDNVMLLSSPDYRTYHYFEFSIQNNSMFASWQIGSHTTGANGGVFYSHKPYNSDEWVIQQTLPQATLPVIQSSNQTWDGKIAGIVYASSTAAIYMHLSDKLVTNSLPVAVISVDKEEIFWGESVNFNGGSSSDSDGAIVKYEWLVIPDNAGFEGASAAYKFSQKYGNVKVRLTVTDDKGGRGSAEKTISVKALYTAPATWSKQQVTTLIYNREGNVITWVPNAKNQAAGYNIVKFKIFRKEAGGAYQEIVEVGADKRVYADITIEAGKTYFYAVSSVDDLGHNSPYDNF